MEITVNDLSYDSDERFIFVAVSGANVDGIIIPVLALASRRKLYDLQTDQEAFMAILHEHFHRMNGSAPKTGNKAEKAAGLQTKDANIKLDSGIETKLQAILDEIEEVV